MKADSKYEIVASGTYRTEAPAGIIGDGAGVSAVETEAGVVTLTLPGDGLAQEECVVMVQLCAPQPAVADYWMCPTVTHTSDTVKTVNMAANPGVATTSSFMFAIFRARKRN
jgi:hypothetical protein